MVLLVDVTLDFQTTANLVGLDITSATAAQSTAVSAVAVLRMSRRLVALHRSLVSPITVHLRTVHLAATSSLFPRLCSGGHRHGPSDCCSRSGCLHGHTPLWRSTVSHGHGTCFPASCAGTFSRCVSVSPSSCSLHDQLARYSIVLRSCELDFPGPNVYLRRT